MDTNYAERNFSVLEKSQRGIEFIDPADWVSAFLLSRHGDGAGVIP